MKLVASTLISFLLLLSLSSKGTTYKSVASGSWSSNTTWSPSGVPGQSDDVILQSPYKVTSSGGIAIGTTSGGSLTIKSGATLDMGTNDLSISNSATINNSGTLLIGTLELNGSTSLTNSGTLTASGSISLSTSGTFTNSGTLGTGDLALNDGSALINNGGLTASTLETNSSSSFTDNGTMTVTTSIAVNSSSTISVAKSVTLNDQGSYDDYSSTSQTTNGVILVTGTATFYGGAGMSGTGYLTGGEIQNYHNISVWTVPSGVFPCFHCTIPTIALPIDLISFTAAYNNDAVQVQWASATETDNNYYTLSRSTDGVNYTAIATVKGAGQSSSRIDYSYTDETATATVNYYKLQQTDFDGATATLGITAATLGTMPAKEIKVFPNPAKSNCIVSFSDEVTENFQMTVYDCTGRQVQATNIQTAKGQNNIELNTSALSAGVYIVTVPVNGTVLKSRIVKY